VLTFEEFSLRAAGLISPSATREQLVQEIILANWSRYQMEEKVREMAERLEAQAERLKASAEPRTDPPLDITAPVKTIVDWVRRP